MLTVDQYKKKYQAFRAAAPEPEPDWMDTVVAKANLMPDTDHTLAEAMQTALRLGSPFDYEVLQSERKDMALQLNDVELEKMKDSDRENWLTKAYRFFTHLELKALAASRAKLPEFEGKMPEINARKVGSRFRELVIMEGYNPAPWERLRQQVSHAVSPQHSRNRDRDRGHSMEQ